MTRLAILLSALWLGCGGSTDAAPPCRPSHEELAAMECQDSSFDGTGEPYRICWPGDGTYWLFTKTETVHQELGKTAKAEDAVLCREES